MTRTPLAVTVDLLALDSHKVGIATYGIGLVRGLLRAGHQVRALVRRDALEWFSEQGLPSGRLERHTPVGSGAFRRPITPIVVLGAADLIISPNARLILSQAPVTVVLQNRFVFEPAEDPGAGRFHATVRRAATEAAIAAAAHVVDVSGAARGRAFPTIRPGVDAEFWGHLPRRRGGDVLVVGTVEQYKGVADAYEVFARSLDGCKPRRTALRFVGPIRDRALADRVMARARRDGQLVEFVGQLDREDLARTLAGARALLCMSHRESYGLPPLEAMAAGVPVVIRRSVPSSGVVGRAFPEGVVDTVDGAAEVLRRIGDEPSPTLTDRLRRAAAAEDWSRVTDRLLRSSLGEW